MLQVMVVLDPGWPTLRIRMHGIVKGQARRPVRSRAMIVFMISEVPP
jgi:hypothetical protein